MVVGPEHEVSDLSGQAHRLHRAPTVRDAWTIPSMSDSREPS
jgi:hypothetical protein